MCGPSRTSHALGIRTSDWYLIRGGDGFQSRPDPEDPNIVYATSQSGGLGAVRSSHRPRDGPQSDGRTRRRCGGFDIEGAPQQPPQPPQQQQRTGGGAQGGAGAGAQGGWTGGAGGGGRGGGGDRDQLGRAVHHQPALEHAALLGEQLRLSQRRPRRYLDADQPGSLPQPEPRRRFRSWARSGRRDRLRSTSRRRRSRTSSRSTNRRSRKGLLYVGTDDGLFQVTRRRRQELAQRRGLSRACRSRRTSRTSSRHRATRTSSSRR